MTTPIGGIAAAQNAGYGETMLDALGGMGSDGFMKLMVAQLQYQNPMEPTDTSQMMSQTAALAQLDASQQLLSIQQRDFGLQQAAMAAGMLGDEVTGTAADGAVSGVVDGVRYTEAGPVLTVGGDEIALSDVTEIRRATAAATA